MAHDECDQRALLQSNDLFDDELIDIVAITHDQCTTQPKNTSYELSSAAKLINEHIMIGEHRKNAIAKTLCEVYDYKRLVEITEQVNFNKRLSHQHTGICFKRCFY